jgi:hypothetical protein
VDFALDYTVRPYFQDFHDREERFACIVAHRRSGKTVACIYELLIRALYTKKVNARFAYVAPFFRQAKDTSWTYLKQASQGIAIDTRESELRIVLPNGAWITLYGGDNPNSLRGIYLDGVVIDEIADCRPSLWVEVILPTLVDRRGWAAFIGTVRGKNHFYDLYENAIQDPAWFSLMLKPEDTDILPPEDLQEMKNQMDEASYSQEFLCDFTAAVKGTYYSELIHDLEAKARTNLRNLYDPNLPVQVAADLGYTDSTAFWFWQERSDGIAIIDFYENQGEPLSHYIDLLESKPYDYLAVWLPHDARAKTLQTGRSTIEQLQEALGCCRIAPSLKVQQGIEAVRMILPLCFFGEEANTGLDALRNYKRAFNELTKSFRESPLHDWASDGSDAFRYLSLVAQRGTLAPKPQKTPEKLDLRSKITLDQLYEERDKSAPRLSLVRRRI